MLVISRKKNERIKIGKDIEIVVVEISKNQVKLGINAPKNLPIFREELLEKIEKENKKANKEITADKLKDFSKEFSED